MMTRVLPRGSGVFDCDAGCVDDGEDRGKLNPESPEEGYERLGCRYSFADLLAAARRRWPSRVRRGRPSTARRR